VLPDALRPGPPGAWDDLATWTGSVIEHDGRWHMLYTGISRAERGLIQRIGLAVSDDLTAWRKHPANPVLQADGRWYELLDLTSWRTFSYSARAPAGPYRASAAPIAPADGPLGTLYAGKLAEAAPGDWRFLAFCASRDGAFAGELTDPLPIRQDRQGTISIAAAHG
jgi:hypothetical protein